MLFSLSDALMLAFAALIITIMPVYHNGDVCLDWYYACHSHPSHTILRRHVPPYETVDLGH